MIYLKVIKWFSKQKR